MIEIPAHGVDQDGETRFGRVGGRMNNKAGKKRAGMGKKVGGGDANGDKGTIGSISGSSERRPAAWGDHFDGCYINGHVIRLRLDSEIEGNDQLFG